MGYKYTVWGCGVGKSIARCLAEQPDTDLITIVDKDKAVLKIGRLFDNLFKPRIDYIVSDIESLNLEELFKDTDVVISALPAGFNPKLAEAAIKSRVGFCDLGGVIGVTLKMLELNDLAKRNDVSIIPDCGLMPGLGMIMAQKLFKDLTDVRFLEILVGGMPQKPQPPVYYQLPFYIGGLKHLCYDMAPILTHGSVIFTEPLSDLEELEIPALKKYSSKFNGRVESFITSGASVAPWRYKELGLEFFAEKTLRWPGFVDFVKNIPEDRFEEMLLPNVNTQIDENNPDFVFMRVHAVTSIGQVRSYDLLDEFDPATGLTAMERTTGFPTAMIARMIARKETLPGVNTPDFSIPPKLLGPFIEELSRHFNINRR